MLSVVVFGVDGFDLLCGSFGGMVFSPNMIQYTKE